MCHVSHVRSHVFFLFFFIIFFLQSVEVSQLMVCYQQGLPRLVSSSLSMSSSFLFLSSPNVSLLFEIYVKCAGLFLEFCIAINSWSHKLQAHTIPSFTISIWNNTKKYVTCDMWHVTHDMWQVTRDTWQVTHCANILSKFQLFSSYGLGFMMFWRYGGKGSLT